MTDQDINITIDDNDIDVTIDDIDINITMNSVGITNFLAADQKLYFNGAGSNTYLMFNATTNRLELWVNGVKQDSWGEGKATW